MEKKLKWIVKFSCITLALPMLVACAKQPTTGTPQFSDYYSTSSAADKHRLRIHHAINPSTGLGDPTKINQYEKVKLNIWQDMAANFSLPEETDDNPEVKKQIDWFMQHPKYMHKMTRQAEPYLYYICEQVKARNLPPELALMPMVESAYNPFAVNSGSGATGLWQMMPGTASGFGLHVDWWYDGRRDISASTSAALDYLAYLGNFFNNDWALAMAAYDSGEGTVQQAIERNAHKGKDTSYWGLHLPRETQDYVPKILALATILKHPELYPIDLPDIPNAPYLAAVEISSQIDLHKAAQMADMSLAELSTLNPGYNRWATDPNGSFKLLLPISKVEQFKTQLDELLSDETQIIWNRIVISKKTTVAHVAAQYQTSKDTLIKANKLKNEHLTPGQSLLVPQTHDQSGDVSDVTPDNDVGEKITTLPDSNVIHHIVIAGESLKGIANRYHVSLREIKFWNELHDDHAKVGTDLVIWPPKYVNVLVTKTISYKVKRGDTLHAIAKRFHVNPAKLAHSNHLKHSHVRPGQTLHITVMKHEMRIEKRGHHSTKHATHHGHHHTKHKKKSHKTNHHKHR